MTVTVEIAASFDVPVGAGAVEDGAGDLGSAGGVHQPNRGTAMVILPKDVGMTIAVEVAFEG